MSRNGGDWGGLNLPQACDGIIPPQSSSIRVDLGINEQIIKEFEMLEKDTELSSLKNDITMIKKRNNRGRTEK
jgi:hypothetical protein